MIYVGCAGWNIPKASASRFPTKGSHLERYSRALPCVEINSSFYRPHRRATYERWRDSVPADFRFSVKMPKQITHERRLIEVDDELAAFVDEISGLDQKLGCILIQLPPSLAFADREVGLFFAQFRRRTKVAAVCEPRHPTWFCEAAERRMMQYEIARVAADPAPVSGTDKPAGCTAVSYYRWHGSPRMYYSAYDDSTLQKLTELLRTYAQTKEAVWCIFDNTAQGAAFDNAVSTWRDSFAR